MKQWETITLMAIDAYQEGAMHDAITQHRQALVVGKEHFATTFSNSADKAVAIVIVSHLNLIDIYISLNDYMTAQLMYESASDYLMEISLTPDKSNAQDVAIYRGAQKLKLEWARFLKHYGKSIQQTDFAKPFTFEHTILKLLNQQHFSQ